VSIHHIGLATVRHLSGFRLTVKFIKGYFEEVHLKNIKELNCPIAHWFRAGVLSTTRALWAEITQIPGKKTPDRNGILLRRSTESPERLTRRCKAAFFLVCVATRRSLQQGCPGRHNFARGIYDKSSGLSRREHLIPSEYSVPVQFPDRSHSLLANLYRT
jgi:hypothetical protein